MYVWSSAFVSQLLATQRQWRQTHCNETNEWHRCAVYSLADDVRRRSPVVWVHHHYHNWLDKILFWDNCRRLSIRQAKMYPPIGSDRVCWSIRGCQQSCIDGLLLERRGFCSSVMLLHRDSCCYGSEAYSCRHVTKLVWLKMNDIQYNTNKTQTSHKMWTCTIINI